MSDAPPDVEAWLPRWHPATVLAFAWARLELRRLGTWRTVDRVVSPGADGQAGGRVLDVAITGPWWLPDRAVRGVLSACARTGATCLPRSLVRQAWEAAHGRDRDLVIGVTAPARGFRAHAWLAGDPEDDDATFTELTRRPPIPT